MTDRHPHDLLAERCGGFTIAATFCEQSVLLASFSSSRSI
jgi:hypothetical protein